MDMAREKDLLAMIHANDKLLKAMVTLLCIKDDYLLGELRMVFSAALQTGNPIGQADDDTWGHLRKEMGMISSLVEKIEGAEPDSLAPGKGLN